MSDPRDEKSYPKIPCVECEGTGYVNEFEACMACCGTGEREMTFDEYQTFINKHKYGHHEKL